MYGVFENGKPCSIEGFPHMHPSWNNHKYPTFAEALEYLKKWLGAYSPPENYDGSAYDYDGYGDVVEIKEI